MRVFNRYAQSNRQSSLGGGKTRNEEIGNRKKRNVEIRKWSSLLKITMLVI